jgi:hypothetical protein
MEKAYIADIFDGEGTIGIYTITNGRNTISGKNVYYCVRLSIVGTHMPMIKSIYSHYKMGSFCTQKRQALMRTPSYTYSIDESGDRLCKQSWKWLVTSKKEIKIILNDILPYLIEKKEQVQIALDFIDGKLSGEEAYKKCKDAKKFSFSEDTSKDIHSTYSMRGEENPMSSLTNEQANEIRQLYKNGTKQIDIALSFGISKSIVNRIVNNKTYKDYSNPA